MTVKIIKCDSPEEARTKAEIFKDLLDDEQIIVIEEYLCTGKSGDAVECVQEWDATSNKYVTTIYSQEDGAQKAQQWIEDFEEKTKVR